MLTDMLTDILTLGYADGSAARLARYRVCRRAVAAARNGAAAWDMQRELDLYCPVQVSAGVGHRSSVSHGRVFGRTELPAIGRSTSFALTQSPLANFDPALDPSGSTARSLSVSFMGLRTQLSIFALGLQVESSASRPIARLPV